MTDSLPANSDSPSADSASRRRGGLPGSDHHPRVEGDAGHANRAHDGRVSASDAPRAH